jgi:hypothetical protein
MKRLYFILALTLAICFSHAQTFPWAKSAIGTGSDEGMSVSADTSGNAFITGYFTGSTITFGTYTLTKTTSSGANAFLAKYDKNGSVLWAKNSSGTGVCLPFLVNTDISGNAFVTGVFTSPSVTFGTYSLICTGVGSAVFIAKYDINGNALWAKGAGGIASDYARSVSTDASGNSYITGYFKSPSITFGAYTLTNTGSQNVFLTKYDTNGNVLWAKSSIGTGSDEGTSVSTDASGNAFVTGYFQGPTITFGTYTLTNLGATNMFLVKYDSNGNVLWAKNTSADDGSAVSVDASGNALVLGDFSNPTTTFGTYTLTNSGLSNVFIAKYDGNGNVLWAKSAGGTMQDYGYSISTYTGGVYVTGKTTSPTLTFGTNTITVPPSPNDAMFIAQYDLNGSLICAKALAGGGDDQNGVSADKFGNAYITGDFQPNPFIVGSNTLTLTGGEDVFIAKFNCQPDVTGIKNINKDLTAKLYPNPNNGSFTLQFDNTIENGELILFNSIGQQVHEQKITQGENKINTNALTNGLYHYTILQNKFQVSNGKIAIE